MEVQTFEGMLSERVPEEYTRLRLWLELVCSVKNKPRVTLTTKGPQFVIVRGTTKERFKGTFVREQRSGEMIDDRPQWLEHKSNKWKGLTHDGVGSSLFQQHDDGNAQPCHFVEGCVEQ